MGDESRFHKIKSLAVQGGFLDGLQIEFSPSLNCIIGGRGTGKTTVLEFLRHALQQMPDEASDAFESIDKLVRTNLATGTIEVQFETANGIVYKLQKTYADAPVIVNEAGEPVPISLSRSTLFGADFYSQNQIEEIAKNPRYQLELIDKFIAEPIHGAESIVEDLRRRLHDNATRLLKLHSDCEKLGNELTVLPEIEEKIRGLSKPGDARIPKLEEERKKKDERVEEKRAFDELCKLVDAVAGEINTLAYKLGEHAERLVPKKLLGGTNAPFFQEVSKWSVELFEAAQGGVRTVAGDFVRLAQRLSAKQSELDQLHAKQDKAYQDLISAHKEIKERASTRESLVRQQTDLLEKKRRMETLAKKLEEARIERQHLLSDLSDACDKRYALRAKQAEVLTNSLAPMIRVSVEQFGSPDEYEGLLMTTMKRSGMQYRALTKKIVQRMPPQDLARYVQAADRNTLMDALDIDDDKANRLILQLQNTPEIYKIETVELRDKPSIELKDGDRYKVSTDLSTGQKCTTILPILLLESEKALLIDQPEDNLDNAFIYETVVSNIRNAKRTRQLIFITHNPNIPVLGDAERVLVMESDGKSGRLHSQGTVDGVKEDIERLLEGGREAFQMRKKRYGH